MLPLLRSQSVRLSAGPSKALAAAATEDCHGGRRPLLEGPVRESVLYEETAVSIFKAVPVTNWILDKLVP